MKKNLKDEIAVREERHRREMRNLDRSLESKTKEEAIKILDGVQERAQGLIACIDRRIGELDSEVKEIESKRDRVDIGLWIIVFGFLGVAMTFCLIMGLLGS